MQRFDLVEKLKGAEDQVSSLNEELKAFIRQFVEAHRKFKDGQKVEVFDYSGKTYGIGFVKSAHCGVSFKWGFRPHDYVGKTDGETMWVKDLTDIMYSVVKMKKDGTPSERMLLWEKPRQEKILGYYYLMPIE